MHIAAIILEVLLGAMFLMAGLGKFAAKQQVEAFKHYGYPQGFRVFTGIVEVIGAAGMVLGIWYPVIATLAGLWIAIIMVGAVITHVRVKDPAKAMSMSVLVLILAVIEVVLSRVH